MTLSLGRAVELMKEAREASEGAVLLTCVASTAEDVTVGARLFWSEVRQEGGLERGLDGLLAADARTCLRDGRSRTLSYSNEAAGWKAARAGEGQVDVFFDVAATPAELVIVGAGHIAVPLASIAHVLDFRVIVVDDRPEYANRERFPDADEILVGPYRETVRSLRLGPQTHVVLVTRGHVHDQACLEEVLPSAVSYIGMIGSKRRVRTVLANARAAGADPASLARVCAPVGLAIGAETPAEIALAIMAEIVNRRRGGSAPSLALPEALRG